MKNKTKKDFEKWILKQVDYYKFSLGLDLNKITVKEDNVEYFGMGCSYPYLDSEIKYSQNAFEDWTKGIVKKDIVLHELCHVITDPFYVKAISRYLGKQEIEDEREKLTDTVSAIIRRLIK